MNILNVVTQYLESKGFVGGPAYHPGCFFYEGSDKNQIILFLKNGKVIDIWRTKEPTVILINKGWADDMKTCIIDLANPNSINELDECIK